MTTLGFAQPSVQVVTKVIEKEFSYSERQRIQLAAQKADVIVKGWNRPTVSVRLRLIAKHPDRAVAEREVAYHQYALKIENGQIDLSNRFVIPQRAPKLQSQLKAIYEVNLPIRALLTLTNSFGDIRLSAVSGDVVVNFEFGQLTLEDIGGQLAITSNYGDIDGRRLAASLTVKAEKADVVLQDLGGTVHLQSHYGRIASELATTINSLTVEAARTEILLEAKRLSDFRFDISSAYGDIRVPEELASQLTQQNGTRIFNYQRLSRKPEVIIHNSYSPTIIQDDKSIVNR